jgi:hypothetical protein
MTDGRFSLKRIFLRLMIASIALSAALGILGILTARYGWFDLRILLTTVTIGVASISGLACGASLESGRQILLPRIGIGLTALAAALMIIGMWMDVSEDAFWKIAVTASIFAVSVAHISLLSMAGLAPRFQWTWPVANVIVFGLASLLSIMFIRESGSDDLWQIVGVLAILDAAVSVVIPVLHRLSAHDAVSRGVDVAAIDREIATLRERILELEQRRAGILSTRQDTGDPGVT